MSEPEAGSDLASLRCAGGRSTATTSWSTARRRGTRNGHRADWCQLYVRTDPDVAQAQGHHLPARRHAHARHRGPPDHDHGGRPQLQRAVPHRRPRAASAPCSARSTSGWSVATRTLSNERAGVASLYLTAARQARPAAGGGADARPGRAATQVVAPLHRGAQPRAPGQAHAGRRAGGPAAGSRGQRDQAGVVASPTRRWPTPPSTCSAWPP